MQCEAPALSLYVPVLMRVRASLVWVSGTLSPTRTVAWSIMVCVSLLSGCLAHIRYQVRGENVPAHIAAGANILPVPRDGWQAARRGHLGHERAGRQQGAKGHGIQLRARAEVGWGRHLPVRQAWGRRGRLRRGLRRRR